MHLQFVTIGQNLNWPRGRLSLARKKKRRREFMTLALARVNSKQMSLHFFIRIKQYGIQRIYFGLHEVFTSDSR